MKNLSSIGTSSMREINMIFIIPKKKIKKFIQLSINKKKNLGLLIRNGNELKPWLDLMVEF